LLEGFAGDERQEEVVKAVHVAGSVLSHAPAGQIEHGCPKDVVRGQFLFDARHHKAGSESYCAWSLLTRRSRCIYGMVP
jgi:hypothetical protein